MKENITKFDLEDAFKALDEIDVPKVRGGIKANRLDLKEALNRKPQTDSLLEDYYDVSNPEDLNNAKEERDADIAKAKLARIEKIVDLDAASPDDLLPSYVGKVIVQCPQCLTLFYKNEEDVVPSEDDETIANVGEVCQHCGNESGYTIVGKVAGIEPEEGEKFGVSEEPEQTEEEEEVEVKEEEPAEENAEEESQAIVGEEEPAEEEEEIDLDALTKAALEGGEEEKKEESFAPADGTTVLIEATILTEADEEPTGNFTIAGDKCFITKAEMNKLEDEKDAAGKEVAKYKIPIKTQLDKDGKESSVPDFSAVPEDQQEAAKAAFDRYAAALKACPSRAKYDIRYIEESVEKPNLTESSSLDTLLDRPDFKSKVDDSAVGAYLDKVKQRRKATTEDLDEPEFDEEKGLEVDIDDIDEVSFEECLNKALSEIYENVGSFKLKECKLNNKSHQLILEGIVSFKSGKIRTGRYIFNTSVINENSEVKLIGKSNLFEGINRCVLLGKLDTANCLTTEAISYVGHIGEDLVEGYVHK